MDIDAARAKLKKLLGELPATDLPLALFPVRLETRFLPPGKPTELWIRVYPDDLHIDTHEPELTEEESEWGQHFWVQTWRAANDRDRRQAVWAQLAERFGAERAAWIARALQPQNTSARPKKPLGDDEALSPAPAFPSVKRRAEAWTRAPAVRLMPDRWVVYAYRDEQLVHLSWGEPIPEALAAGPSPSAEPPDDIDDEQLSMDPGMQWLVDFEAAEQVGMAMRIGLAPGEARKGFDRLVVVGMNAAQQGKNGARAISELLDAQHYTDGLAFVAQGAPTNNTQDIPSSYSSEDPGHVDSYAAEWESKKRRLGETNAAVLAKALGIDSQILTGLRAAQDTEQADARAMNAALWPATWGYFLQYLMHTPFSAESLHAARRHFIDHVQGRGPLPTLRVGNQPYGVLPVSAWDRWQAEDDSGFEAQLVSALGALRRHWQQAAAQVPRLGDNGDGDSAYENLKEILQIDAMSRKLDARLVLDSQSFGPAARPPAWLAQQRKKLQQAIVRINVFADDRWADLGLAGHRFALSDDWVQAQPLSDTEGLKSDYINWLRTAELDAIKNEHHPQETEEAGIPNSLLYLLLRHACLVQHAEAAFRLAQADADGEETEAARPLDPPLVDIFDSDTATLGRHLDRASAAIKKKLAQGGHTQTEALDEFRRSLDHLQNLSSAKLDQLVRESIGLCAYRLDAWLTSLASRRLDTMRAAHAQGVYYGGFGWLEDLRPAVAGKPVKQAPPGEANGTLSMQASNAGFIHAPSLTQAATAAILRSGYLSQEKQSADQPFAIDLSSERVRLAQHLLEGMRQGQSLGALLGYRLERGLHERKLDHYIAPLRRVAPLSDDDEALAAKQQAEAAVVSARARHTEAVNRRGRLRTDLSKARRQSISAKQQRVRVNLQIKRLQAQLLVDLRVLRKSQADIRALEKQISLHKRPRLRGAVGGVRGGGFRTPNPVTTKRLTNDLNKKKSASQTIKNRRATNLRRLADAKRKLTELDMQIRTADNRIRTIGAQLTRVSREIAKLAAALKAAERVYLDARERVRSTAIDGLALHNRFVEGNARKVRAWDVDTIPFGRYQLAKIDPGVVATLQAVGATLDAVGDAITAESVFQSVRGNPIRSGATLDAVARGDTPPPELEVVRTPRSGVSVTHRLLVLLNAAAESSSAWPVTADHARAAAEPSLNAWVGQALGNPKRVRCRVSYIQPHGGEVLATRDLRLSELHLCPLDIVYAAQATDRAQLSELEQRLVYHLLRTRPKSVAEKVTVQLDVERAEDWKADDVGLGEFLEVAATLGSLLSGARALQPQDFGLPEEAVPEESADVGDLKRRADVAIKAFGKALGELETMLESTETQVDLERLRERLLRLAQFGIDGAVPLSAVGAGREDREALLAQARSVWKEASTRHAALLAAEQAVQRDSASSNAVQAHDVERLRTVFGQAFRVLPRIRTSLLGGLREWFGNSRAQPADDPFAALNWLQRCARVREACGRLNSTLLYTEALGSTVEADLHVGQLPDPPGSPWIGLPLSTDTALDGDRYSWVAQLGPDVDLKSTRNVTGLLIDEWVEMIPNARENTAVAFHYDAPAARPPQAVLLAVPPDQQPNWEIDTLADIVNETLASAKLRAVEPAALAKLGDLGFVLPALYVAHNPDGATVSSDFTRAAAPRAQT